MMPRRHFTPYPTLPQHERAPPTPGARSTPATLLVAALLASLLPEAEAQELEPRAYSNLPVGMNFLARATPTPAAAWRPIRRCRWRMPT